MDNFIIPPGFEPEFEYDIDDGPSMITDALLDHAKTLALSAILGITWRKHSLNPSAEERSQIQRAFLEYLEPWVQAEAKRLSLRQLVGIRFVMNTKGNST